MYFLCSDVPPSLDGVGLQWWDEYNHKQQFQTIITGFAILYSKKGLLRVYELCSSH